MEIIDWTWTGPSRHNDQQTMRIILLSSLHQEIHQTYHVAPEDGVNFSSSGRIWIEHPLNKSLCPVCQIGAYYRLSFHYSSSHLAAGNLRGNEKLCVSCNWNVNIGSKELSPILQLRCWPMMIGQVSAAQVKNVMSQFLQLWFSLSNPSPWVNKVLCRYREL